MSERDLHHELRELQVEVDHLKHQLWVLRQRVEADFDFLLRQIHGHPHPRPARSATLVGKPIIVTTVEGIIMAEVGTTGELVSVVALGADGAVTTDDINGPALTIDDPSGVFVFTVDPSNLSCTIVPNPDVFGTATVTFNATDINGAALLDPATGAAPVYEATVTAPPNPAVSATLQGTPL